MGTTDAEADRRHDDMVCPDCGSRASTSEAANSMAICGGCGRVVREASRSRSASEDEEEDCGQTGYEPTLDWSERSTVSNSTENQVASAFAIIEALGDELTLPREARAEAAAVFNSVAKGNLSNGRPMEVTVAAAVLLGARRADEPRPLAVVAETIGAEVSTLAHVSKRLRREIDQECSTSLPHEYLPYLCKKLGVDEGVQLEARQLLELAESSGVTSGCSPPGFAGAALYLAVDGGVTQRATAAAAGVTMETIRVRLNDLRALEMDSCPSGGTRE